MSRSPVFLLFALAGSAVPQEPGIPLELARSRASRVSKLAYALEFRLEKGMESIGGSLSATFELKGREPLVIDADLESIEDLRLNGRRIEKPERSANHLLLPGPLLQRRNELRASFRSRVAPTGTPLTVYRDKSSGAEYYYTLLVPAEAHRLFPCFDQPDLKARFSLDLLIPERWKAVANGPRAGGEKTPEGSRIRFRGTKPLPTYLFAFAAGPFEEIQAEASEVPGLQEPMRIFLRPEARDMAEPGVLFRMHRKCLGFLNRYFDAPYPFEKLDLVLCPGFPYGGMEHAGAIFYRETALAFDHEPSPSELLRRSTLIYHETTHQWFGNLVTMLWFDDLWLKEGFATFLGYKVLEHLEPSSQAWLRFHQRIKPPAYRVDGTPGTTPVYQELGNLTHAKSNYGPIVYNKAPAILRELENRIGAEAFQEGVRAFLEEHAFKNATWRDLLGAMEKAGGMVLGNWSEWWILKAGMPEVRCSWEEKEGRISDFVLRQRAVQEGAEGPWPMKVGILLQAPDGSRRRLSAVLDGQEVRIPELDGTPSPLWVLLNPDDLAYGRFLPDPKSLEALLLATRKVEDPLLRTMAFTATEAALRKGELPPGRFAAYAMELLEEEKDPPSRERILSSLGTTLRRFLPPSKASPLLERFQELLLRQLRKGGLKGMEIASFKSLVRLGRGEAVSRLCWELLRGRQPVPGFQPGAEDLFLAASHLVASGDRKVEDWLSRVRKDRGLPPGFPPILRKAATNSLDKLLFLTRAASPSVKEEVFDSYLDPDEPPEQWVQSSLSIFHWPGQEDLCLPFLRKALEQVEWVKEHRRIFFMPAWLDAFINGHSSERALLTVEGFLAERGDLPRDIRLKILQSLDGLRRAVRIRAASR